MQPETNKPFLARSAYLALSFNHGLPFFRRLKSIDIALMYMTLQLTHVYHAPRSHTPGHCTRVTLSPIGASPDIVSIWKYNT